MAVLASLALLAGAWESGEAHADPAGDEIVSNWSSFRAEAIAQGVAYQITSNSDALASGARERWGGAVAGSVPYGYALTSDVNRSGIASIYWPSYVVTQYKEALPVLAETVPFVNVETPDPVVDGVKVVAEAAPTYPFIAWTSGAEAREFTTASPTQIPGGSVAGATMRCNPGAASVRCAGSVTKAQLGAPTGTSAAGVDAFGRALALARVRLAVVGQQAALGRARSLAEEPAAAVTIEGIDMVANAVLEEHEVRSLSKVTVTDLDILGVVRLGSIRAVTSNVANGRTSEVKRTVAVAGASVGDQPVTISNEGVNLAGNSAMEPADYDKANTQLREALSAAGVTIRLFGGTQTKEEGSGTTDEGEGLYVGLKLPEPGVPDSFFYLNYWVGATVNAALGVPSGGA